MADDRHDADDVLSGLPRARPQRSNPKRDAARAKAAAAKPAKPASARAKTGAKQAKPTGKAAAKPAAKPAAAAPRPVVKADTPARGYATPRSEPAESPDLTTQALQAAGEVIGLGGRVIKGVLDRLPRL